jgi:hypothetical protein
MLHVLNLIKCMCISEFESNCKALSLFQPLLNSLIFRLPANLCFRGNKNGCTCLFLTTIKMSALEYNSLNNFERIMDLKDRNWF